MRSIAVVSRKGGSGKTTLAAHLAVAAERAGAGPVALIDTDPQASLADWWNARSAETPLFVRTGFDRLEDDSRRIADAGVELLVVDTPPAVTDSIEKCIALADIVVIPSRPSPHDIRSVLSTVKLVEHLGKPLVFVLNAAVGRARITSESISILSQHGPIAPTVIGQRLDFAVSMIDGRTVMEMPGTSKSSEEIADLWTYLAARLRGDVTPLRMSLPKPKARPSATTPLLDALQAS